MLTECSPPTAQVRDGIHTLRNFANGSVGHAVVAGNGDGRHRSVRGILDVYLLMVKRRPADRKKNCAWIGRKLTESHARTRDAFVKHITPAAWTTAIISSGTFTPYLAPVDATHRILTTRKSHIHRGVGRPSRCCETFYPLPAMHRPNGGRGRAAGCALSPSLVWVVFSEQKTSVKPEIFQDKISHAQREAALRR